MEFEWDADNLRHILVESPHGVTPELVDEVAANGAVLVENSGEGRSGSHKMIGRLDSGRFWTIVVLDKGNGTLRPITGWPSTNSEIGLYRGMQ